ncbi:MAG: LarC family nickel insertion protein [Caulobacteraceae bacterium]|nr:LarC family nickel insertion protein [Caulobacteraceae bacterium]
MTRLSVVLRTPSGISGDMLLTGLARLSETSDAELAALIDALGVPALTDAARIEPHTVNGISGWRARIELPHEHHHRTLRTILDLIAASALAEPAKALAARAFTVLAEAEAKVHGIAVEEVHFHEVGALDSILDTCMAAALFTRLDPARFYCSPLPICDGTIRCEHGLLASPPPAVQEMLSGVPVYGADAQGETVTPTALAFLKAAGAIFGRWPQCEVCSTVRAYGAKVFPKLPNGAMFFSVLEP